MRLALERPVFSGLAARWQRSGASSRDDSLTGQARPRQQRTYRTSILSGIVLLGVLWGAVVAIAGLNALYLCVSLIGCAFILRDFRIGVVLLILLMPVSNSSVFPHAMLGITGLNPLNLLLVGTLFSCLFHGLFDGSLRRFLPRPLVWLYILPIVAAGVIGSRHVGEIAPAFYIQELVDFDNVTGYVRDMVAKPLFMVIFALLVGAKQTLHFRPNLHQQVDTRLAGRDVAIVRITLSVLIGQCPEILGNRSPDRKSR